MKGCKFYSKFFSITNTGLTCLLCSINTNFTSGPQIRQHIRKIHFNNIGFKKINEVMEKSVNSEMNDYSKNTISKKDLEKSDLNNEGMKNNEEMKNSTSVEMNIKNNTERMEKSENDSRNSYENAELGKTCISRSNLFQENNTESQNVITCAYCGEDFVNKIHLKFCQTASKYVMNNTCMICGSESDSFYDTLKHVREHHLNVICEIIERENSEKSNEDIKTKNSIVNISSKIEEINQEFEIQDQEKLLRIDYGKLSHQSNYEIEGGGNDIATESQLQNGGTETISGGNEIIDIEEMKVEVIEIEPCNPEKEKSNLLHSPHPQSQTQIISNSDGKYEKFQIGNQDFEKGQTLPIIGDIFSVKEQAEAQLDHVMDGMEILPHD